MIKSIFVGRRAGGRSRAAAMRHLLDVHGPMVVCRPADAGPAPSIYVQNHVFDGVYPERGEHGIERDLVTEFWFDSVEDMQASGKTPYYLANMKPDEPHFVTTATVARMRVVETMVVDGVREGFTLFLLAGRAAGCIDADWAAGYARAQAGLAAAAGSTAVVRNDVVFPDAAERFADIVLQAWFGDRAAAAASLDRADALLAAFGGSIDHARTLVVVAQRFDAETIRARQQAR